MKDLKSELQIYGGLNDIERPLVVSALLLAMQNYDCTQYPKLSFIETRANLNREVPELGTTPLRYFADMLSEMDTRDIISGVYGNEYSYSGSNGHDLGIVLTPTHIVEICCELLGLKAGDRVIEPCCGTGRFLVNAMRYVGDAVTGIEFQEDLYTLSSANVKINGGNASQVIFGDFFTEDLSGHGFTAGFMNPPYSQKITELVFIERLMNTLDTGGRATVIVPVSAMIGKTKADKQLKAEILRHHTLEGVISLNKDTFYGVGTVTCIAVFTAGKPHPPEKLAKFISFEDDGWEVRKHVGLVETPRAKERRQYLLDCWRGKATDCGTKFMVQSAVEASDEWLHSFYYYNDEKPTAKDFEESIADYLTFEANMIFHGHGDLFEGR